MSTTTTTIRRAAAVALVALGVAGPGSTQPASAMTPPDQLPKVADGALEHTVVRVTVSGSKSVPSDARTEHFVSADASRSLRREARTGRLESEAASGPKGTKIWSAEDGRVRSDGIATDAAVLSVAAEAQIVREQLAEGSVRQIGEQDFAGRHAVVLESVRGVWRSDDPEVTTTIVADAETFVPYRRTSERPGMFRQVTTYELIETLPLAGNEPKLEMGPHKESSKKARSGKKRAKAKKRTKRRAHR